MELFILPTHFIPESVTHFNYINSTGQGLSSYTGGLFSRALETIHRLTVGGEAITGENNSLSRKWLPDDSYITNPHNAKNGFFGGDIKRTAGDESDGPNSNIHIGPDALYKSAKESKNGSNGLNISWSVPVEKNIDHYLRLHLCDIFNDRQSGFTFFTLFI
ncbi:putative non-specific serine/threonine protein kinase [Medicago truncatula]|uniref:Putative non-specific serine/threonine protein kinase n=1 Tax=Medicago truncatula TaxID=3880 RepID=A0A396IBN0_MEDTR|nr:putative non-specific serine/threonine protein kinase [Medicago truncatula]